jgi:hypothetical protein
MPRCSGCYGRLNSPVEAEITKRQIVGWEACGDVIFLFVQDLTYCCYRSYPVLKNPVYSAPVSVMPQYLVYQAPDGPVYACQHVRFS